MSKRHKGTYLYQQEFRLLLISSDSCQVAYSPETTYDREKEWEEGTQMLDAIAAKELDQFAENPDYVLVDLRSERDFARGHIAGAVNAPDGLFKNMEFVQGRTMILYCERGAFSMQVARRLGERGYRVKTVVGGIRAYRGRKLIYASSDENAMLA